MVAYKERGRRRGEERESAATFAKRGQNDVGYVVAVVGEVGGKVEKVVSERSGSRQ